MATTDATTKERPILFSGPMVRALIGGRKTQTRRALKPQPTVGRFGTTHPTKPGGIIGKTPGQLGSGDYHVWYPDRGTQKGSGIPTTESCLYRILPECPYGMPGDRLWVRESWRTAVGLDAKSPAAIAESCIDAGYPRPWAPIKYEADGRTINGDSVRDFGEAWGKTRVSIHMPRWASRITLEITDVRVERLQGISVEDAWAEGLVDPTGKYGWAPYAAVTWYQELWESINGPGSWAANPWVWAITFRRVTP